ncbi:hypothetical protein D3C78_373570 [compost metagenome]
MASCAGGSCVALRLRPGAWRRGMVGLSTTVSRPSGLQVWAIARASLIRSVWLSSLYSEGDRAIQRPGTPAGTATAAASSNGASQRLCPVQAIPASAPAAMPVPPSSRSASTGVRANSAATTARLPTPAPRMSKA